jgi:hypothetical protein
LEFNKGALYSDVEQGKDETKSPLKALEFIEKYDKPAIFVLKDFHIYFGGQGHTPDFQVLRKIDSFSFRMGKIPSYPPLIKGRISDMLPTQCEKEPKKLCRRLQLNTESDGTFYP